MRRSLAPAATAALTRIPPRTMGFERCRHRDWTPIAENIDPASDGSQYAYAENVGWINAEPFGNGGPGLQVDDFEVTGFMWGENVGWINLSREVTSTCGI